MTASAKGTVDQPGTQVRQKAGLNRAIRERGWGLYVTLLAYKGAARGGQVIRVPAAYSSQECPRCGHRTKANQPTRDGFGCQECGYEQMADVKAAETMEDRGRQRWGVPCVPIPPDAFHPPEAPGGSACEGIGHSLPMKQTAPPFGGNPPTLAVGRMSKQRSADALDVDA